MPPDPRGSGGDRGDRPDDEPAEGPIAADQNPQRPYAGGPGHWIMRWSHLHGDMQGWHACMRGRAVRRQSQGWNHGKTISEIPCRVSSDLHEWRNDLGAVSTRGSVKLQSRRSGRVPAARRKDPVNLYYNLVLGLGAPRSG